MTEQTQPTDAELLDAADDFRSQYKHGGTTFDEFDALGFARAVLAKWGTPAGAGEPTEAMIDAGNRARLYREHGDLREEAVLSARTHNTRATWFAMCEAAPQHTQAQAGAVPLTDEQIEEIAKQFITRVGSHWEHDDAIPDNGRIEDFVRAIEHAHGIKGADHV